MIFKLIQVERSNLNAISRPPPKPLLIKLLVLDRYDVRNVAPLVCPRDDGESIRPSDIVMNESNTVSV